MTERGNIKRIRLAAAAAAGVEPKTNDLDREELAGRVAWGNRRESHEGLLTRKPWEYPVCAVIPTCGSPELTALAVGLLARQTVPIYSLVIDTGSGGLELERLQSLRCNAVEVHQMAAHGWRHSAEAVGAAMAMGQSICRSEYLLALHSDAFLTSRDAIYGLLQSLGGHLASGYQSGPLPGRGFAERFLSHSTTIAKHADLLRYRVPWDRPACQATYGDSIGDEYDPEFGLNLAMNVANCQAVRYLGQETREPQQDERRIHLSAATSMVRMGGLGGERVAALTSAMNIARDQEVNLPAWAWQGLTRLIGGHIEPSGVQFTPRPWEPTTAGNVVTFVAPFYLYDPILLDSLNRQTDPNWRLILIHDGRCPDEIRRAIALRRDHRVCLRETIERFNDWGHTLRQIGLNMIAKGVVDADWVVITNGDNYYVPGFVAAMVAAVKDRPMMAAYCDIVHNYWGWNSMRACLQHGDIDCGCLMVRKDVAIDVGWRGREVAADWTYCADVMGRISAKLFAKVDRLLFIHN